MRQLKSVLWIGLLALFSSPIAGRVIIVEIHYHPPEAGEELEFVELYNDEPLPFDVSGYSLREGIDYTFPPGSIIEGHGVAVVARNPQHLVASHGLPGMDGVYGPFWGRLGNGGEELILFDTGGSRVCRVRYDDRERWPSACDGAGPSLVLSDPLEDPGESESWGWSRVRGGTPGVASFDVVEPEVVLNEVHREEDQSWVELFNPGLEAVDLSSYELWTDAAGLARFVFPAGHSIEPRGFLALHEAETGLSLGLQDQALLLVTSGGERIVDARRLGQRSDGAGDGRCPDGSQRWLVVDPATPGETNRIRPPAPVVISEIHYHPYHESHEEAEEERREFVELTNIGDAAVDLEGFSFTDGIDYVFPPGSSIAPGEYLVVAKDPELIQAEYSIAGVLGPYGLVLADNGEMLCLSDPRGNPVDEVRFYDDGYWPRWCDGDGPSLERVDLRQESSVGSNWQESEHAVGATWQFFEYAGRQGTTGDSEFHIWLMGAGEVLVDDMELVRTADSSHLLREGNFDGANPLAYWRVDGTHVDSYIEEGAGPDGTAALRIVSSKRGDCRVNHIEQQTSPGLSSGQEYTVRFRARWLRGSDLLMTRTWGHGVPRMHRLQVPSQGGTPGRSNSRAVEKTGPSISWLRQTPPLPRAGEEVTVQCRVSDPDGVAEVGLLYRLDGEETFTAVPMRDDGAAPDFLAGDDVYAGTIQGMGTAGSVAEFLIEAKDGEGEERSLPAGAPDHTFLYQYDDGITSAPLPAYRIIMLAEDYATLTQRSVHSNHHLPASLVYSAQRIFHLAGVRYKGSPFVRPHPGIGIRKAFRVRLSEENPLRGGVNLALDESGPDPSVQADRTINYLVKKAGGVPYGERHHIHMIVRGRHFGVYEEALSVGSRYLERAFGEESSDGDLYKVDNFYEVSDGGDSRWQRSPWQYWSDKEFLRFNFKKRTNEMQDEFTALIELLGLLNSAHITSAEIDARLREAIDLDQWARALAVYRMASDWDTIGGTTGKNIYLYDHPDGRWRLIPWDHDVSLGTYPLQPGSGQGPRAAVYLSSFPMIYRLLRRPCFDRKFLAEMLRLLAEEFTPDKLVPILDDTHAVLSSSPASGSPCPVVNPIRDCYLPPDRIKTFLSERTTYLLGSHFRQYLSNPPDFTIETDGAASFDTARSSILLTGTAPYEVDSVYMIRGDGEPEGPQDLRWVNRTTWELAVDLDKGPNELELLAFDRRGRFVGDAAVLVTRQPPPFSRGDANGDGIMDVSDSVFSLLHQFSGGPTPGCIKAADVNGDGVVDISDPTYALRFLFSGGPMPPSPYPDCGFDPTGELTCESYGSCEDP